MPLPNLKNTNHPRYCGNHRHLLDEWLSIHQGSNQCERAETGDGTNKLKRSRKESQIDNQNSKQKKKDRGKRVPCPIDPSHLIFESALAKHVLVCPAVKQKQEVASKDYYSEGINLGGFGDMGSVSGNHDSVPNLEEAKELAFSILRVFHFLFLPSNGKECIVGELNVKENSGKLTTEQLQAIGEEEIYNALPEVDLSAVEEGISDIKQIPKNEHDIKDSAERKDQVAYSSTNIDVGKLTKAITKHRIKAGGPRHLRQIASILGHARQSGLISTTKSGDNKNPLIVEMGAGRGMTGLVVAGAVGALTGQMNPSPRVSLSLIERAGTRAKAETKIRTSEGRHAKDDFLRLDLVDVTRVKCDLAHVVMPTALPSELRSNASKTVVIAKHLCGAGTDIALKSLRDIKAVDGCIMATCCHGLCSWNEFVGRNFFLRLFCSEVGGLSLFGEKHFNLIKRWTSASVLQGSHVSEADSSTADTDEMKEEHGTGIVEEEKGRYPNIFTVVKESGLACGGSGLGRACQRLIDMGRCDYIRNHLFLPDPSSSEKKYNVGMLHYVPREITPQNALLLASRV